MALPIFWVSNSPRRGEDELTFWASLAAGFETIVSFALFTLPPTNMEVQKGPFQE